MKKQYFSILIFTFTPLCSCIKSSDVSINYNEYSGEETSDLTKYIGKNIKIVQWELASLPIEYKQTFITQLEKNGYYKNSSFGNYIYRYNLKNNNSTLLDGLNFPNKKNYSAAIVVEMEGDDTQLLLFDNQDKCVKIVNTN